MVVRNHFVAGNSAVRKVAGAVEEASSPQSNSFVVAAAFDEQQFAVVQSRFAVD